ncbi:lectin MOA-related protein [Candidatus Aerophobetes bacterium]|nr:lectin MOA-related protein [Candidatus Aerophobetes bacterium]
MKIPIWSVEDVRRKVGFALIESGISMLDLPKDLEFSLRSALNAAKLNLEGEIQTFKISHEELEKLVKSKSPQTQCIFWDRNFWYPRLEDWKKFITEDLVNFLRYKLDHFDCDNFSTTFKAHIAEYYGINGIGVALGALYKDDQLLGYHSYNILLAREEEKNKLICYEPQTDEQKDFEYEVKMSTGVVYRTDLILWY